MLISMNKFFFITFFLLLLITVGLLSKNFFLNSQLKNQKISEKENKNMEDYILGNYIKLPSPDLDGKVSLEKALKLRRSIREYSKTSLTIKEVSQLLWAAQGITNEKGFRTAPSAGATFPLEMYILANNVVELQKGLYHYLPFENKLKMLSNKDVSSQLMRACLNQSSIGDAAVVLIFGAVFERTTAKYGKRGERYVYNEIGHASQNVYLQATVLNLGTVAIGAYRDEEVEAILNLGKNIKVLYLMPVGKLN